MPRQDYVGRTLKLSVIGELKYFGVRAWDLIAAELISVEKDGPTEGMSRSAVLVCCSHRSLRPSCCTCGRCVSTSTSGWCGVY